MATQCNDIETLIPTYLDGELVPHDRFSFEHHVADCAECRELVRAERAYQARLRELLAPPAPPDDLGPRIRQALDREQLQARAARRQIGRTWALPGFATVAAAAALVLLVVSETRSPDADGSGPVAAPHSHAHDPVDVSVIAVSPFSTSAPSAPRDSARSQWTARDARFDVVLTGGQRRWVTYQNRSCREIDLASYKQTVAGGARLWVGNWPVSNVVQEVGGGMCAVFASDMDVKELVSQVLDKGLIRR
jgi:anti-sigma factor RsiW